jgi:hypothetical protein
MVRVGLILLCTLIMTSSASARFLRGVVLCEGTVPIEYLAGVEVSAFDASTHAFIKRRNVLPNEYAKWLCMRAFTWQGNLGESK